MNNELCMGCMSKKGGEAVCPRCGYAEGTPNPVSALKVGTMLDNRYIVGAVRKMSGEGITYIAIDDTNGRKVIMREFMPATIAGRAKKGDTVRPKDNCEHIYQDYLSDFLEISRAVSRLSDVGAIVPVLDIFESNNTAYAVYEYINANTLGELVQRAKRLTWEEARPLFLPLISAMSAAHAIGLVHFGISPDSVMLTREGSLMISDFGIPDSRIAETELRADLADGFSAPEQYSLESKKGKWTDVYSLCALILFALTGKYPPDAPTRCRDPRLNVPSSLADTIPTHVLTAISGGLQVDSANRIPSMDALRSELGARGSEPKSNRNAAGNAQRAAGNMARNVTEAAGRFVSNVQNAFGQGGKKAKNNQIDNSDEPWYRRLSQLQYGLLSACLSILVLGTIAVIVFLNVRHLLNPDDDKGPTVQYLAQTSGSDMIMGDITDMYTVPDLRGVNIDIARSSPDYIMFDILATKEDYSDDYEVGEIISQSIKQGTEAAYETPIAVTVSLGSKMCAIPNIVGKSISEADAELIEAGLCLGSQKEEYNDSVPAGCIISVSGAEIGSRLTRGSAVNVVVSLGPEGIPAQ